MNPTMTFKEWALLFLLSILWGGSFYFVEIVVAEMPPFTLVFGRVGIASAALIVYVYASGRRMPTSLRQWGPFAVMGILNSLVPYSLIAWGQIHIESGLASILNATTPLFSVVLTHFFSHEERITPGRIGGVLLGLLGVIALIGPDALAGLGLHGLGQLAVLAASFSYACSGIYGRRLKELPPAVAAAGQITAVAVMVAPLALAFERPWSLSPTPGAWAALLGLALLSTAIAYLIFFRILAAAGATNVMLVTFLIPISALFLGVRLLGERPGWTVFAGMGLIFIGLAAIDGRFSVRRFLFRHREATPPPT
jgi:drug/metabolite transporter (DMT)-like permease